jgi:YVTN family beta-propeller protein
MRRDLWNAVVDVKSCKIIASAKTGDEPEGVTIRPDGKVVYVTSEGDGDVAAIDTTTNAVLKRIPVGHRPRGIGFLPDGSRAFVTLEDDGAIAVIDSVRHGFLRTIQLGDANATPRPRPMGIAVRPDGSMIYVTTVRSDGCFLSTLRRINRAARLPSDNAPGASG